MYTYRGPDQSAHLQSDKCVAIGCAQRLPDVRRGLRKLRKGRHAPRHLPELRPGLRVHYGQAHGEPLVKPDDQPYGWPDCLAHGIADVEPDVKPERDAHVVADCVAELQPNS